MACVVSVARSSRNFWQYGQNTGLGIGTLKLLIVAITVLPGLGVRGQRSQHRVYGLAQFKASMFRGRSRDVPRLGDVDKRFGPVDVVLVGYRVGQRHQRTVAVAEGVAVSLERHRGVTLALVGEPYVIVDGRCERLQRGGDDVALPTLPCL